MSGIILSPDFLEPLCSFGCDQKKGSVLMLSIWIY